MSNRIFGLNDPGNAFRRTDAAPVKQGGIFKTYDGQNTFTDGQGNIYWFVDTTSGNVTITLPAATDVTPDTRFIVKRTTAGANTLTIGTDAGNIDGSATYALTTQYAKVTIVSDGSVYWTV